MKQTGPFRFYKFLGYTHFGYAQCINHQLPRSGRLWKNRMSAPATAHRTYPQNTPITSKKMNIMET